MIIGIIRCPLLPTRKRISLYYYLYFRCVHNRTPYVESPFSIQVDSIDHDQHKSNFSGNKFKYFTLGIIPTLYYIQKNVDLNIHIIPKVEAATNTNVRSQFNFIADAVEKTCGAVVCIEIKDVHRLDFFAWAPQTMTNGSGFIVEKDGLILTNAHVVMASPQSVIHVKLADGTLYRGHVEDIDMNTDLATIRIKPKVELPTVKLGESKDLRAGEFVIAMGSPLTLSNTVTSGIISSTNRKSSELNIYGKEMSYIQTDAAITFGNSGGPLINLDGEVVGINSMRVAQTGGISFAIPVDYAKEFLKKSRARQSPSKTPAMGKRYLGLTMLTLNSDILREMQLRYHNIPPEITEGAVIWKVVVGSPAYKSGLMPGDIVTEINGVQVKSSNAIYKALESDSVLNIKIYRGDRYYGVVVHPENII